MASADPRQRTIRHGSRAVDYLGLLAFQPLRLASLATQIGSSCPIPLRQRKLPRVSCYPIARNPLCRLQDDDWNLAGGRSPFVPSGILRRDVRQEMLSLLWAGHPRGHPAPRPLDLKFGARVGDKIEGKDGAARSLGLSPSTLRTRMKKLGIHRCRGGGFS